MSKAHEHSNEEMLIMILQHLNQSKKYWATVKLDSSRDTVEERLDGLCFSFLTMLDGVSAGLPTMEVIPTPHPDDEEYLRNEGENWWPNQTEKFEQSNLKSIGSGHMLHDLWHEFCRGNVTVKSLTKNKK